MSTREGWRRRSDRGITVIFFGIALTAMLAAGGLVLGGSIGYTAVRNAQTAADATALAGATALREHKTNWVADEGGVSAEQLLDEIESVANDNGADLVRCELVNARYAISGAESDVVDNCDRLEYLTQEEFESVAGISVDVSEEREVPFAAFVGQDSITATASAAATAQPVGEMRAPFLLCSTFEPAAGVQPLVYDETVNPPTYAIDDDALGLEYVLWGNPITDDGRNCGMEASSWRGLADTTFTGSVGGWWRTETGNTTGQLASRTNGVGTCDLTGNNLNNAPELLGCEVPVPLCLEGQGDTSAGFELRCVMIAVFEITHVKGSTTTSSTRCDPGGAENVVCGKLVGPAVASHGRGYVGNPDDQVVVIKLVQ